jgi:hypothetical protein
VASLPRLVLLLILLGAVLRGQTSLENAVRAQTLLGPEVWSRVITVRNETRISAYPKIVHAVVFELVGVLWFYTDSDGTQSFSRYRGQVESDKDDFGALLRDIEPGFVRWSYATAVAKAPGNGKPLLNGCFIESVVAWRERLQRGLVTGEPRLLAYYTMTRHGRKGHTVLAYVSGDLLEIFDPARPEKPFVFARSAGENALALARAFDGGDLEKARFLPLVPGDIASRALSSASGVQPGSMSQRASEKVGPALRAGLGLSGESPWNPGQLGEPAPPQANDEGRST